MSFHTDRFSNFETLDFISRYSFIYEYIKELILLMTYAPPAPTAMDGSYVSNKLCAPISLSPQKQSPYPLHRKLGRPQGLFRCHEDKKSLELLAFLTLSIVRYSTN
jgi:hypothetical protein